MANMFKNPFGAGTNNNNKVTVSFSLDHLPEDASKLPIDEMKTLVSDTVRTAFLNAAQNDSFEQRTVVSTDRFQVQISDGIVTIDIGSVSRENRWHSPDKRADLLQKVQSLVHSALKLKGIPDKVVTVKYIDSNI